MRSLFIAFDFSIGAIIAMLVGFALLFQPMAFWVIAVFSMLGGFFAIIGLAKKSPSVSRLLALLCPVSYTIFYLYAAIVDKGIALFAFFIFYYAAGVSLLSAHRWLIVRIR